MPTPTRPPILMPIGDATEAVDTLYPFFRVAEDGFRAVVCGPEARTYHMVLHEVPPGAKIPWDITEERPGYHIKAEVAFRDVDPTKYAGLFVSGGRAPEYLRYDKDLLRITRHFFEANKPVAVVCHGIEIVSAAGVIRGRTVTTVAKCALDAEQGGARYVDQPTVVDGNLVTARTWHDSAPFMREFMKMLQNGKSKHVARRVHGPAHADRPRRQLLAARPRRLVGRGSGPCRARRGSSGCTLSIGTYSMKGMPLEDAIGLIASIGYDGIEIATQPGFDGEPAKLSARPRGDGSANGSTTTGLKLTALMEQISPSADDQRHRADVERIGRVADLAREVIPDAASA